MDKDIYIKITMYIVVKKLTKKNHNKEGYGYVIHNL